MKVVVTKYMSLSHQLNIIRIVIEVPLVRPIDVVILDGPVEAVRPDSILALKNVIACDISAKRAIIPVSGNPSGFVAAKAPLPPDTSKLGKNAAIEYPTPNTPRARAQK